MGVLSEMYNAFIEKEKKRVTKCFEDAQKMAQKDIVPKAEQEVENANFIAISTFYDDYEPSMYQRTDSLYDMIEIKKTDDGVSWYFDSSKAYGERIDSAYIYQHVFREGFHGGARGKGIPVPKYHPACPYDGPAGYGGVPYSEIDWRWKPEIHASVVPLTDFKNMIQDANDRLQDEYTELIRKYFQELVTRK